MCRYLFSFLLIVSTAQSAIAQQVIGKMALERKPEKLLCTTFRDSLLITGVDRPGNSADMISFWVHRRGVSPFPTTAPIIAIASHGGRDYYYYFTNDGKHLRLQAFVNGHGRTSGSETIPPGEELLGYYVSNNLLILFTLGEEGDKISVIKLRGLQVIRRDEYVLPDIITRLITPEAPVEIYTDDLIINSFKGKAQLKIFYRNDKLYVIGDGAGRSAASHTVVYTFDTPGSEPKVSRFLSSPHDKTTSLLFPGERIVRLSMDVKRMLTEIFDLSTDKLVSQQEIPADSYNAPIILREGRSNRIENDVPFKKMFRSSLYGNVTLFPYLQDSVLYLQCGTYQGIPDAKPAPGILTGFGLAPLLLSAVAHGIVVSSAEVVISGTERYAQAAWDLRTNSVVIGKSHPHNIRTAIDKYELDKQLKEFRYTYKSYWPYRNGIVALYYDTDVKFLYVVYFAGE